MGKSKLKLTRSQQTKLSVSGILEDPNTVVYTDENGDDKIAKIDDLFSLFVGKEVCLLLSEKIDDDIAV